MPLFVSRCVIFALVLSLAFSVSSAITINEIMYDPAGSDTDREWIELYNNESFDVNLTGWKFSEGGTNHGLTLVNGSWILGVGKFAVIADDSNTFLSEYPDFNSTLFDSSFSLSNSGEELVLKNSSLAVVENITYNSGWGANGTGSSLQFFNGSWCEGTPTPGFENNCTITNVTSPANTTNTTVGDCDLSLDINTSAVIYNEGDTIDYDLIVSDLMCSNVTHSYLITYSIENFFGGFLRTPYNSTYDITCHDTSSHQKQADEICGTEAYWIKAEILESYCNDTNLTNNYDEFLIVVKGKNPESSDCKTSSTSSTKGTTSSSSTSTTRNFEVKILNFSEQVGIGQSFITQVMLTNFYSETKTFAIYSYAYKGQTLASEGGWVGNRQNVTVAGSNFEIVDLQNRIKADAKLGDYTFKVRAALGDEKSDAVSKITIVFANVSSTLETPSKPKSAANISKTQQLPENKTKNTDYVTGALIWSSEKTSTSTVAMLLFIFVLLILVLALLASNTKGLKH